MTTRAQLSHFQKDADRHTALMVAALEGHTQEVKELVRRGADINAKDSMGRTALMFAAINMHYETVKVLLEHGAEVNARSNVGGTALMLAASSGEPRIVEALLDRGADTHPTLFGTNTNAMTIAVEHVDAQVIRLLNGD